MTKEQWFNLIYESVICLLLGFVFYVMNVATLLSYTRETSPFVFALVPTFWMVLLMRKLI
jgi:hypothetical protein